MAKKLYPPSLRQDALERYFGGDKLAVIAKELSVPYGTVHSWAHLEGWPSIRRQIRANMIRDWQGKTVETTSVLANKNLQENLAACNAVAERVLARMTEPGPIDSRELKTLAQVLAREFDVVTKLLGSREPRAA